MNENDLARRIVSRLDQDLTKLPADIVGRLADARARALQAPSRPVPLYVQLSEWVGSHRMMVKVALPALFLLVAAGAVLMMQSASNQDPFDVETALLADELPIHAYTDPGFDAWLRNTSHEEQQ